MRSALQEGHVWEQIPKPPQSVLSTSDLSTVLQSDNACRGERDVRMETAPATKNTSAELRPGPGGAGLKDGTGDTVIFMGWLRMSRMATKWLKACASSTQPWHIVLPSPRTAAGRDER